MKTETYFLMTKAKKTYLSKKAVSLIVCLSSATVATGYSLGIGNGKGAAEVSQSASRGSQYQVNEIPVPMPIDYNCESWRPIFEKYDLPFDSFRYIIFRESRCSYQINLNRRTGDESYGPLQVNRIGSLGRWWDSGGYTIDVFLTVEGSVAAAGVLYKMCGLGPWTKPYSCNGSYRPYPYPEWGEW